MKKYILGLLVVGFILAPWLVSFAESDTNTTVTGGGCVTISNSFGYRDRDINKGNEVSTLQNFLHARGYLNSNPTGYFGLLTKAAVINFQKANNISSTGYIGSITKGVIKNLTCNGMNGQTFTGYLSLQGNSTTMWGTHTLTVGNYPYSCTITPCPLVTTMPIKIYSVSANNNSVLADLYRYQNSQVTITGELSWIPLEGGFWGITASKVIPFSQNGGKVVISGVSGPQTLNVNQTGTWTVNASDSNGGTLYYTVDWGDRLSNETTTGGYPVAYQRSTFSYSYSQAGTYTARFTVTNAGGQSASTSLSVNVGGIISADSITVLSPNGGENIQLGQSYVITWNTVGFSPSDNVYISLNDNSINCAPGIVGCWTTFGIGSTKNTGSYLWNTNLKMTGDGGPNSMSVFPGNNFKILLRVTSANNPSFLASDYSDNSFTISSPNNSGITVLSPNGGEVLTRGNMQTISWQDNTVYCYAGGFDCPGPVPYNISLVSYCSGTCVGLAPTVYTISQSYPGSPYNWQVGHVLSNGIPYDSIVPAGLYKVQVCSLAGACDTSDNPFTIQ